MEHIKHFILQVNSVFSLRETVSISLMSIIMGIFVYITYRLTHRTHPDKTTTCLMISLSAVCALTVYAVLCSGSLLLLSAVILAAVIGEVCMYKKDRDIIIFYIWSVACGIMCAERKFISAAVLCVLFFVVFMGARAVVSDMSNLLTIEGEAVRQLAAKAAVFRLFEKKAKLISESKDENGGFKLVYRVSAKRLEKLRENRINIIGELEKTGGISNVKVSKEDFAYEK